MSQSRSPQERRLEDPDTWTGTFSMMEARWTAALLAQFIIVQDDGGVMFPKRIHIRAEITVVPLNGVLVTRAQMLSGLDALANEKLLNFSRTTMEVTLLTGFQDLVRGFVR